MDSVSFENPIIDEISRVNSINAEASSMRVIDSFQRDASRIIDSALNMKQCDSYNEKVELLPGKAWRFSSRRDPHLLMFTTSNGLCDSTHSDIMALSRKLISPDCPVKKAAVIVRDWVAQNIIYGIEPSSDRASDTLSKKTGMCLNKATLQVALLRAAGIPSGFVVTYMDGAIYRSFGMENVSPLTYHAFAAVYLPASDIDGPSVSGKSEFNYYDSTFPFNVSTESFIDYSPSTGGTCYSKSVLRSDLTPVQGDVSHIFKRNPGAELPREEILKTNRKLRQFYTSLLHTSDHDCQDIGLDLSLKMRVWAVSDLHCDYSDNMDWLKQLPSFHNDAVIVAGDVSDNLKVLRSVFVELKARFKVVFYVPGNHEAWITSKDSGNSLDKLDEIKKLCSALGIITSEPALIGGKNGVWVVPLWSWYDDSLDISEPSLSHLSRDFKDFPWVDFKLCKWPDIMLVDCDTVTGKYPGGVAAMMCAINKRSVERVHEALTKGEGSSILSFSHFLPNKKCLSDWLDPSQDEFDPAWLDDCEIKDRPVKFSRVAGTELLEEQIRGLTRNITTVQSHTHIFGHSHRPKDFMHKGIRYVHNPVGNPREQQAGFVPENPLLYLAWDSGPAIPREVPLLRYWQQEQEKVSFSIKGSPPTQAVKVDDSLQYQLAKMMARFREDGAFDSCQVCVLGEDCKSLADVSAGKIDNRDVMVGFSITKAVGATLAHLMVEQGFLSYDEPICEQVWPQFCPKKQPPENLGPILGLSTEEVEMRWGWKRSITLRHILDHTAGLWCNIPELTVEKLASCEDCSSAYEYSPERPQQVLLPVNAPGENCTYHIYSFGWLVAGTLCGAFRLRYGPSRITFSDLYEILLKPKLSKETIRSGFYPFGGTGDNNVVPTYVRRPVGELKLAKMYPSPGTRQKAIEGNSFLVRALIVIVHFPLLHHHSNSCHIGPKSRSLMTLTYSTETIFSSLMCLQLGVVSLLVPLLTSFVILVRERSFQKISFRIS